MQDPADHPPVVDPGPTWPAMGQMRPDPRPGRPRRSAEGDAALRSLEDVLGRALGYSVAVKAKASGEGEIRIRYATAEERDALCRKLGGA